MRRRPGRRPVAPLRPLAVLPALAALLDIGKLLVGEGLDNALGRQRSGAGGGCRSEREGDRPDHCDDCDAWLPREERPVRPDAQTAAPVPPDGVPAGCQCATEPSKTAGSAMPPRGK